MLRILSQRLINQANDSNQNTRGVQNFTDIYSKDKNILDNSLKLNVLESEKNKLIKAIEEKGKFTY